MSTTATRIRLHELLLFFNPTIKADIVSPRSTSCDKAALSIAGI